MRISDWSSDVCSSDLHFRIAGLYVDTNRDEDETSITLGGEDLEFDGIETQHEDIHQQTYAITSDAAIPLSFAELGLAAGWSGYRDDTDILVYAGENENDFTDLELDDEASHRTRDDEYTGTVSLTLGKDTPLQIKPGIDLLKKDREGGQAGTFLESDFTINETRYSPYLRATFQPTAALTIDAGLRYEITDRDVEGVSGDEQTVTGSYKDEDLNPSLHLRYAPSDKDQFRVSLARTVRSEEHTSDLQSRMRFSYAVFRLKKTPCRNNKPSC